MTPEAWACYSVGEAMVAIILSVGTELTRGELVNTNASWLAEELTRRGVRVARVETVPDSAELLRARLPELSRECELLVSTGGLGPTTDDLTAACVAEVLAVPLERDEASLARIRARMARLGRTMARSNEKQADLPKGARVLTNDWGTAPGFEVTLGRARAFFLPGVPTEMQQMFERWVAPVTDGFAGVPQRQVRLRAFGLGESEVNDRLAGLEADQRVVIGYRAHFPEIEVKLLAERPTLGEAEAAARAAADEVRRRLGDEVVYGEGDVTLPGIVGELLESRGYTLALAESCTGGLVAKLLTDAPGASRFFRGGVVSYANDAKRDVLGVPGRLMREFGAVSRPVALAMAEAAARVFGADVALAVTGVAGPDGGTAEKPVGLVHLAAVQGTRVLPRELSYPATRERIRLYAAFHGLALVRRLLVGAAS